MQWGSALVWPGGVAEAADGGDTRVTALREAFEETSLLFDARGYVVHVPNREEARKSVHADASKFGLLANDLRLPLPVAALKFLAHWTTPVAEKKRFNTFFYLAQIHGADAKKSLQVDASESSQMVWLTPRDVLQKFAEGRVNLAPPQWFLLQQLSRFDSVEAALASVSQMQRVEHIAPTLAIDDQARPVIALPGDELNDVADNADAALASRSGLRRRIVLSVDASDPQKRAYDFECNVPQLQSFALDSFKALSHTSRAKL
jgi:8-oxo-dGTP pyrophosphatase MutT (NUDIX family)